MKSIYLDFQIFDKASKSATVLDMLKAKGFEYYCSVAHIEELWRAYKNSGEKLSNKEAAKKLEQCIDKLCAFGVLNPSELSIILKEESVQSCLCRIKMDDTIDTIHNNAKVLKQQHNQHPNFSNAYHKSSEKWKAVWDEATAVQALEASNANPVNMVQIEGLYVNLCNHYGREVARNHIANFVEAEKQNLVFGCYPDIRISFHKLERAIEKLSRILSRIGYERDKNVCTFNSGEYDVSHLIYATYCDYLVTNDSRLYNRALAIYHFLKVPTKVILWSEFDDLGR